MFITPQLIFKTLIVIETQNYEKKLKIKNISAIRNKKIVF